jgi:hypothetical protein
MTCSAVITVFRAGFLVTMRGGTGLVVARLPDGGMSIAVTSSYSKAGPLQQLLPWEASEVDSSSVSI